MSQYWTLNTPEQLQSFNENIRAQQAQGKKVRVKFVSDDKTQYQNAMQWALYRDIAAQRPDMSVNQVQAYCKLHFGVGILKAADPEFAQYYDAHFKGLTYEQKIALMTYLDITSRPEFAKEQMSQYLDEIVAYWGSQGVALAL